MISLQDLNFCQNQTKTLKSIKVFKINTSAKTTKTKNSSKKSTTIKRTTGVNRKKQKQNNNNFIIAGQKFSI
jgi:hypothetical protein